MTKESLWNNDWWNLQRQYWDQWSRMQEQALGLENSVTAPWQNAMESWWGTVNGSLPDQGRDFLEKVMDQGKYFFRMSEEFSKQLSSGDANGWKKLLESLAASFSHTAGATGDSASGFWEMPLDNWNRMASAMSPVPGDMLRGMPHTGDMKQNLDRILGAPGLGYTRESQEQYQSMYQSVLEYQEAMAEYSLFFTRMGEGAALRLGELLKDKKIDSARELYDSWIHCCEEEYADQVMTPEYIELHGRLTNALMRLKNRWGELLNEYLSAMNIPTRDDLRTLQRRVQEHRREIRALRTEVNKLRKSLDGEKPAKAAAPKKKTVARKKAAKKTVRKKTTAKRRAK